VEEDRAGPKRPCETPIVATVTQLQPGDVDYVDRYLPLNRLDQQRAGGSTYLVAWDHDRPIGHAHVAWLNTHLGVPEIQDVFVVPEQRRRGFAAQLTDAAEQEARRRGWRTISLSVSEHGNVAARTLYAKLGYVDAGVGPVRVSGTIILRGEPFDVDDTLVYLVKAL
jgi:GNAT superfamily N-acetyltransferase